jgi:hypothetical protein
MSVFYAALVIAQPALYNLPFEGNFSTAPTPLRSSLCPREHGM